MRVLRVYHAGQESASRARERALTELGVDLHLVVPRTWHENGRSHAIQQDQIPIHGLNVRRSGDVNRHAYMDRSEIARLINEVAPDLVDIHEEPFSIAAWQWLRAAERRHVPAVMYTAQNIDKRFPPPFAQFERHSFDRVAALYPCSRQAASVARGKGFAGEISVIPLGFDQSLFRPGTQSAEDDEITLGLFGRLVPEKGVLDAVRILGKVNDQRPTRLLVVGDGPEAAAMTALARSLGVVDRIEFAAWQSPQRLAQTLSLTHIALVPSLATPRWAEQFGRVVIESLASGAVVAGYGTGAIPEVVGQSGILTAAGEHGKLAEAIVSLLGNDEEFQTIRRSGLTHSRHFTWDAVAAAQTDLYRSVIAHEVEALTLPASPGGRRKIASAQFGSSASTPAGLRPFALPVLQNSPFANKLASVIDRTSQVTAAIRARRVSSQRED